ncbi:cytochrome P450 [Calothrix parasitica NIES-267]|uniref:Cytochrome P450 n=1 Tax=Calothrix parasitica NIES-267 TaxID=1973488 RepID=A0A1Z4M1N3_9CYAN|nr:cytochrome P450 [Calothrix parasitica NIES-267]
MFQDIAAQITFPISSLSVVTIFSVTSTVGIIGWRWWKQNNNYKSLHSLPSPPKHWLLGNIPQLLAAVKQRQVFKLIFDWSQQLGPMYVYWRGSKPVVVLSKPKVIEETIINGMRDGSLVRIEQINQAWNDIGGPILLGQQGTEWQWRRKAWNPEFSSSSISKYVEIINEACEQVVEKIQQTPPSKEIQVDPVFVELTMRVICCLVFGVPVNPKTPTPEGPALNVTKLYDAISFLSYRFLKAAVGQNKFTKFLPNKDSQAYSAARECVDEFIAPRVNLALQMREQNNTDFEGVSSLFKESMLVKIAAKEPKYNRESLIAESIELLIAGTDTTAHTLSFAVAELSLNPRIFQQARSVVDQAWQKQGTINMESFKELGYIRAIIKETLRLYSVASGSSPLETVRETIIDGQVIPAGTGISWSMLAAGRDPEVYSPQPEEFMPERWLDKTKDSIQLPMIHFGSGSHRCLGEHLSMVESTVMLSLLLHHFDWELVNGRSSVEDLQQNILIFPADGMPIRFNLRK